MTFTETKLKGAYIIRPDLNIDERGFFARTFCQREFEKHGLNTNIVQCNLSYNRRKGTFRGMHFQLPPFEEEKIVTCLHGALMDYIVDLREGSPTFRQWVSVELTSENRWSLHIPRSFAHGYFTLSDDALIQYQMSGFYEPASARGFRYDDPSVNIRLPSAITTISCRDREFSNLFVPAD